MVLEYKFDYISNNSKYETILDNILIKKKTTYKINRVENEIFLYIEDDENRLLKISNELAKELPLSIFLKDFTLEVVPQIPNIDYQLTPDNFKTSYCLNCLSVIENKELKEFYNPFINCNICGTTCSVDTLEITENNQKLEYKNYKELFELLALKISLNKRVKINSYVFFKLDKIEKENQKLLCTDIDKLSSIVVGSKQKAVTLLSLEKPSIDFKLNTIYQSNNNCKVKKVNISASWNMFLYLLSKELLAFGIDFLSYEFSDEFDLNLMYEEDKNRTQVSINEGRIFLLENNNYDKRLDDIYNKFEEKSKSQFLVLLDENNLYEKSILNFYISSKYSDSISLYSPKIDGILDILTFKLPESINEIFNSIMQDEGGKRLIENYKDKFGDTFINALNFDISTLNSNSIYSLWKIASVILGIDNIYEKGSSALLQKGPRVDHKLNLNEKIFNKEFDLVKFIKSGISFKLAGVDEKTLSLGYVESFVYLLSDLIDEVNDAFELDGISFCGDLFADEFFYKQLNKILNRNFKLYYNKDFPVQFSI